jgi:hypothetical protein
VLARFEPAGMSRLSMATLLLLSLALASAPRTAVVEAVVVDGLKVGFYNRTCPEAEQVVRDVVQNDVGMDRTIAPGLIRIFFHDCFITVCMIGDHHEPCQPMQIAEHVTECFLSRYALVCVCVCVCVCV